MNMKSVSVHIVTYNSGDDIIDCLQAVVAQDYPIERVVVVDNASTDGSAERVREWYCGMEAQQQEAAFQKAPVISQTEDQLSKVKRLVSDESAGNPLMEKMPVARQFTTLPQLTLIENTNNTGFAPAHNQAITATDTDYVLVLNPDLELAPDYVSRLVAVMEADRRIGSATGKLLLKADPSLLDSTGLWMNRARRAFDRGAGEPAVQGPGSGPVFGVSGAAAMYSRRMIEDISVEGEFFDGDFFAYKEDVDVAWRAQLFGWNAFYDAEAVGYHERGWKISGRSSKALFIRRISYINRYKMLYKNEPIRTLLPTLLCSLPYEIAATGYMLLREPQLLRAWTTFWSQRKELRQKRRYIQARIQQRGKNV